MVVEAVQKGLNRWMSGRSRGYFQQHANPTARRFKKALRYSIDHGHPFAGSTIEFAGTLTNPRPHYNGHPPDKTIGHWIVARGYSKGTRRSHFLDPAAKSRALSSYTGSKRFTMKSKRLARTFLRPGHGIAA